MYNRIENAPYIFLEYNYYSNEPLAREIVKALFVFSFIFWSFYKTVR